jgi:alkyl hydroperoxide reductase subunit AhpF
MTYRTALNDADRGAYLYGERSTLKVGMVGGKRTRRRGGRVVECASLENWCACKRTESSNLSLSAIFL